MSVVAYVSGHGLGHAAREVTVLRRLPPEIPLIVKTASPSWFWEAELGREATLLNDRFDIGCIQTDSVTVDVAATRSAWGEIDARNRARRAAEGAWLRSVGARVVVCDVAAFPLEVAAESGIASLLIANFTWADIYAPYEGFSGIAEVLRRQYASAGRLLSAGLALPMAYCSQREDIGLIARVGRERRNLLAHRAGSKGRWALIYPGNWGMPIDWMRLEAFTDWHFFSVLPVDAAPANLTVLSRDTMPHEDLVASVDAVVSKPGYGLVGECLAAGTPLVFAPRSDFAESAALEAALADWEGAVKVPAPSFLQGDWQAALDRVPERGAVVARPAPGGRRAARILEETWRAVRA